jgi:hypothetical protein
MDGCRETAYPAAIVATVAAGVSTLTRSPGGAGSAAP